MPSRLRPPAPFHPISSLLIALCLPLWACGQTPVATGETSAVCTPNQCQIAGSLQPDGTCVYSTKADGTSCDDNNSCTLYDTCKAGICTAGVVLKDGATCDDKNVCTQTDRCQSGKCVGTNPLICPQGDACHEGGICDPIKGCTLKSYGPCVVGLAALDLGGCVQSSYYAPIRVGGSTYALILDSGSTTTAVASASCPNCLTDPKYTPGASATDQKRTASASYGDASGWTGKIFQDTVQAVNTSAAALTPALPMRIAAMTTATLESATSQAFFAGSSCNAAFDANAYQGILGLGPTDLALDYTDGMLDLVAARSTLPYDAFAVSLCNLGGRLWFGGFDPAAATRAPNYTPMVTKGVEGDYYAIAIDDLLVGSTTVGLNAAALGPAIVDTGTSAYAMSQTAFDALTALLAADAGFQKHFPATFFAGTTCEPSALGADPTAMDADLPPLTLAMPSGGVVGGMQVKLAATESYLQPQTVAGGTVYCSTLSPSTITILGSAMMRSQVVVFDREGTQVGFAPRSDSCASTLPTAPTQSR